MPRYLLVLWLVTSVLGYGSVWAFDGHFVAEHRDVVGDADSVQDGDAGHSDCDHCCHASAHIMALCSSFPGLAYPQTGTDYTTYQHGVFFRSTAPPDRPPRS